MKSKADAGDALMYMIQDIGIPFEMHVDGAKEENLGRWAVWLCLSLLNQASFPYLLPLSYVLFLSTINMHLKWNANILYHIHQCIPGIGF